LHTGVRLMQFTGGLSTIVEQ